MNSTSNTASSARKAGLLSFAGIVFYCAHILQQAQARDEAVMQDNIDLSNDVNDNLSPEPLTSASVDQLEAHPISEASIASADLSTVNVNQEAMGEGEEAGPVEEEDDDEVGGVWVLGSVTALGVAGVLLTDDDGGNKTVTTKTVTTDTPVNPPITIPTKTQDGLDIFLSNNYGRIKSDGKLNIDGEIVAANDKGAHIVEKTILEDGGTKLKHHFIRADNTVLEGESYEYEAVSQVIQQVGPGIELRDVPVSDGFKEKLFKLDGLENGVDVRAYQTIDKVTNTVTKPDGEEGELSIHIFKEDGSLVEIISSLPDLGLLESYGVTLIPSGSTYSALIMDGGTFTAFAESGPTAVGIPITYNPDEQSLSFNSENINNLPVLLELNDKNVHNMQNIEGLVGGKSLEEGGVIARDDVNDGLYAIRLQSYKAVEDGERVYFDKFDYEWGTVITENIVSSGNWDPTGQVMLGVEGDALNYGSPMGQVVVIEWDNMMGTLRGDNEFTRLEFNSLRPDGTPNIQHYFDPTKVNRIENADGGIIYTAEVTALENYIPAEWGYNDGTSSQIKTGSVQAIPGSTKLVDLSMAGAELKDDGYGLKYAVFPELGGAGDRDISVSGPLMSDIGDVIAVDGEDLITQTTDGFLGKLAFSGDFSGEGKDHVYDFNPIRKELLANFAPDEHNGFIDAINLYDGGVAVAFFEGEGRDDASIQLGNFDNAQFNAAYLLNQVGVSAADGSLGGIVDHDSIGIGELAMVHRSAGEFGGSIVVSGFVRDSDASSGVKKIKVVSEVADGSAVYLLGDDNALEIGLDGAMRIHSWDPTAPDKAMVIRDIEGKLDDAVSVDLMGHDHKLPLCYYLFAERLDGKANILKIDAYGSKAKLETFAEGIDMTGREFQFFRDHADHPMMVVKHQMEGSPAASMFEFNPLRSLDEQIEASALAITNEHHFHIVGDRVIAVDQVTNKACEIEMMDGKTTMTELGFILPELTARAEILSVGDFGVEGQMAMAIRDASDTLGKDKLTLIRLEDGVQTSREFSMPEALELNFFHDVQGEDPVGQLVTMRYGLDGLSLPELNLSTNRTDIFEGIADRLGDSSLPGEYNLKSYLDLDMPNDPISEYVVLNQIANSGLTYGASVLPIDTTFLQTAVGALDANGVFDISPDGGFNFSPADVPGIIKSIDLNVGGLTEDLTWWG